MLLSTFDIIVSSTLDKKESNVLPPVRGCEPKTEYPLTNHYHVLVALLVLCCLCAREFELHFVVSVVLK